MNAHERRIEELEFELADAERRAARQRQRVYAGQRPHDRIREAGLQRAVDGVKARLARERERG